MFICIGIRKTRNTDDSLGSGTKLLLPSLSLGFRHEERETQFFLCWLFLWLNKGARAPRNKQLDSPRPDSNPNSSRLSPNLNSLLLYKISKNPSPSLPGMTSFTSPVLFPIWGFYCDICDCHIIPVHAWTPALMSAPTHALTRKVLSQTKPEDKIYKTKNDNIKKSFRNHITLISLGNVWINYSPSSYAVIVGQTELFNLGMATGLGKGKLHIQTC